MTTAERYSIATISGNLSGGSLDYLHAAGMSPSWGTRLFRLKFANDAAQYQTVLHDFKKLATSIARRLDWGNLSQVRFMTKRVLDFWLLDTCRECSGRGVLIPGKHEGSTGEAPCKPLASSLQRPCNVTTTLTNVTVTLVCPKCSGTGRATWKAKGAWSDRGLVLIGILKAEENKATAGMGAALR